MAVAFRLEALMLAVRATVGLGDGEDPVVVVHVLRAGVPSHIKLGHRVVPIADRYSWLLTLFGGPICTFLPRAFQDAFSLPGG